ncbi:MAG: ABC transporter permease [Nitrospirae bacterium]|nr:ABC transporter permease [Nitrospirota bacterium]
MNFLVSIRVALRALRVNKMRSALTMLGIIIGVGAVIAMIAVGAGAKAKIAEQIASIGSNLFIVLPGATTAGGLRFGAGSAPTLTIDDAKAIASECSAVERAAPSLPGTAQVVAGNMNWSTIVRGETPDFLSIRDWSLTEGKAFTEQDVLAATKVALLGQTVVKNLFGDMSPVGQIIRIKKVPFAVIGVLARKGQSPMGQDQDDVIVVPVTTAQKKLFGTTFQGMVRVIFVKAKGPEYMDEAETQMTELLRQKHRIGPGKEDDFSVRNLTEVMSAQQQSADVMTLLLGAIASVSLIVGGIGIMNIMLVSVTERTREIGIRMAVGARGSDIMKQFLIEAVTLATIGGFLGIIVGVIGSELISYLAGWPTFISAGAIALAFGFSAAVGVFFGFYPARKAANLDPIIALRYE